MKKEKLISRYISQITDISSCRCGQYLISRYVNSKYTGYVKIFSKRLPVGNSFKTALLWKFILLLKHRKEIKYYQQFIKNKEYGKLHDGITRRNK